MSRFSSACEGLRLIAPRGALCYKGGVQSPTALELNVDGLTLAGKVWGPHDGRPALALHGWLDNAGSFDRIAPLLPQLRLVALDLPGHGRSEHRGPDTSYHFVDAVATTAHVIKALGWPRLTLIGHSMGAGISALLAGTWPERFDAVVFLEGLGPLTEDPQTSPTRLANALADETRRIDRHAAGKGRKRVFESREAAYERLIDVQRVDAGSAALLCERGLKAVEGGYAWAADPRLRHPSRLRFTEAHVLRFLQRIGAPSLLIHADDGWPADAQIMQQRVAAVPDLEVVEVEGRHHVHLDAPERVVPSIRALLERTEVTARAE